MEYQLAQVNVARLVAPLEDPKIEGFVSQLDKINQLADESPGFIWRMKEDVQRGISFRPAADPLLIVNLSVWKDIESLRKFTYQSGHLKVLQQRKLWFEKSPGPHMALWWIKRDQYPRIEQAMVRLKYLQKHGTTAYAFDFKDSFDPS